MKKLILLVSLACVASALTPTYWHYELTKPSTTSLYVSGFRWPTPQTTGEKLGLASNIVLSATFVSAVAVLPWIKDDVKQARWCTIIGSVGLVGWGLYIASHCVR